MAVTKEGRGAALLHSFSAAALAVALAPGAFGQEPAVAPAPTPAPAPVPAAPRPWYETIAVNGFVTTSWSWNFNRPASGTNQYRVFDFDDNTIKIDGAELVLQKVASAPGEAGFRVDAVAGASIPRVSAAAGLFRDDDGKAEDFDLQQAFVSYVAPLGSGLRFDAGKFATHCGYEVIEGYDGYNDNATRSFLFGYAEPSSHTGLKATYAFSGTVSTMVEVV
ncbi:MAG TPA: outer membrane beta-barrel protein, partial [Thermoanaerobaculia bacterium]|nr:outer membrane beta-barrel protein [Thermoanaerobaculia bacterium]